MKNTCGPRSAARAAARIAFRRLAHEQRFVAGHEIKSRHASSQGGGQLIGG